MSNSSGSSNRRYRRRFEHSTGCHNSVKAIFTDAEQVPPCRWRVQQAGIHWRRIIPDNTPGALPPYSPINHPHQSGTRSTPPNATHVFLVDGKRKALSRGQRHHVHVGGLTQNLERPLAARNGSHDVVRLESLAPCGLRVEERQEGQACALNYSESTLSCLL